MIALTSLEVHNSVSSIRNLINMFRYALKSSLGASRVAASAYSRSSAMSTTRYTISHEYVRMEGDIGTVGITKFAADALGDVVFVDLPSIGTNFTAGDSFGSVESVKAASDVYSPIAGVVVEVNGVRYFAPFFCITNLLTTSIMWLLSCFLLVRYSFDTDEYVM